MANNRAPQVNNQDKDFQLYQTQLQKSLQPVMSNPINFGNLLTNVSLISGQTSVNHLLNRNYQGWFVVDQDAQANLWTSPSTNPSQSILFNSSAAVVVSLWVF